MPHVLVDNQKPVEVTPIVHDHPENGRTVTLGFDDTRRVLTEWVALAPARRAFRYGRGGSNLPPLIFIAEVTRGDGSPVLWVTELGPYWAGVDEVSNRHGLDELNTALAGALQWGPAIGEEEL